MDSFFVKPSEDDRLLEPEPLDTITVIEGSDVTLNESRMRACSVLSEADGGIEAGVSSSEPQALTSRGVGAVGLPFQDAGSISVETRRLG